MSLTLTVTHVGFSWHRSQVEQCLNHQSIVVNGNQSAETQEKSHKIMINVQYVPCS